MGLNIYLKYNLIKKGKQYFSLGEQGAQPGASSLIYLMQHEQAQMMPDMLFGP